MLCWFDLITPCRSHHATDHHHATPVCLTTTSRHADLYLVQRCRFVSVDVGLCQWWVWDVGLFDFVDLVCGFVNVVGCCRVFFFFFFFF